MIICTPIVWAVVEGKNNYSWEWFFIELQKCLGLDEDSGVTFIFDEHQVIFIHLRFFVLLS